MENTHLAFLPAPGAGHIYSAIEFSKRLLHHHSAVGRLSVTFLLTAEAAALLKTLPTTNVDIASHLLPEIDVPSLNATDGIEDCASLYFRLYTPHVKSALTAITASVLIVDIFATAVIDAAEDLHIPAYVFFSTNASFLALMLHLPTLHDEIPEEFDELQEEVKVPGLAPIPPVSMPTPLMNKKNRCYTWMVYHGKRFKEFRGVITNTLWALEPQALVALQADSSAPPVHPVGPVLHLPLPAAGGERHECIRWLDAQPEASVVFLCFGSMGQMTAAQAAEAATGIENSGHRFLWILRLSKGEGEGLPLGFRERTSGRGLVLQEWVPQVDVLSHTAVGGFVTHGGWNSCLESLWYGVPMVTWPMAAEQHLNAFLMSVQMGVATEMDVDRRRDGWTTAQEVERKVRGLMGESYEGRNVKKRVKEMKAESRMAVEIGGSSWDALEKLVAELVSG